MKNVVVCLGAGNMGSLVSYILALAGRRVIVIEQNHETLERAKGRHRQLWQASVPVAEEELDLEYVCGSVDDDGAVRRALAAAEFVFEAVHEDLPTKQTVFGILEAHCPHTAILASISSSLPIAAITSALTHRARVVNAHFLQEGIAAVEVMGGPDTNEDTIQRTVRLLQAGGMIPFVLRRENKGFIFNIIWRRIKQAALEVVAKGVATPMEVDRIWRLAFKMPYGPFALMDLVGLHIVLAIEEEYFRESGNPADEPPAFLKEMVAAGKTGRRAGQGFYTYPNPEFLHLRFLEGAASDAEIRMVRDTLLRPWKLVRYSLQDSAGKDLSHPMGEEVVGQLSYSPDGRFWMYLSCKNRVPFLGETPQAGTVEEMSAAYRSLFFSTGAFVVSEQVVVHRVDQCSFPNWCGRAERWRISIENGALVLRSEPSADEAQAGVQTMVWLPQ